MKPASSVVLESSDSQIREASAKSAASVSQYGLPLPPNGTRLWPAFRKNSVFRMQASSYGLTIDARSSVLQRSGPFRGTNPVYRLLKAPYASQR